MSYNPTYRRNEEGRLQETDASIRRSISDTFGFQQKKIVLLEASYYTIEGSEGSLTYCHDCTFSVCGVAYWTNFDVIARAESYDV